MAKTKQGHGDVASVCVWKYTWFFFILALHL